MADLSHPEATPELDNNPERRRGDRLEGSAERGGVSEGEHVRQGGWVLEKESDIGLERKVVGFQDKMNKGLGGRKHRYLWLTAVHINRTGAVSYQRYASNEASLARPHPALGMAPHQLVHARARLCTHLQHHTYVPDSHLSPVAR